MVAPGGVAFGPTKGNGLATANQLANVLATRQVSVPIDVIFDEVTPVELKTAITSWKRQSWLGSITLAADDRPVNELANKQLIGALRQAA